MRPRDEQNRLNDENPRREQMSGRDLNPNRRDDIAREQSIEREPARERFDSLFSEEDRLQHQKRWDSIQTSFVDDPRRAVHEADALVDDLTMQLQESFAGLRQRLEASLGQGGEASTENLRQTMRQYRAFFTRLLSI